MAEVILLPCTTRLNLPPDRVLGAAMEADLSGVLVLGFDKDGDIYMATTYADGGTAIWLMEKCKKRLLEIEVVPTEPPPNGTADVHPIR